jgi:GNAT superfamily N-acetyltransferase
MVPADFSQLTVRDADEADSPALAGKYLPESLLRDYLSLARDSCLRCLVLLRNQQIIGFTLLVFRRPEFWPNAGDTRLLPAIVGLEILESQRGQGYGSAFVRAIETEAAKAGHEQLYLTVAPASWLSTASAGAIPQCLGIYGLLRGHTSRRELAGRHDEAVVTSSAGLRPKRFLAHALFALARTAAGEESELKGDCS